MTGVQTCALPISGFSGGLFIWLSRVANECGESSLSILQWSSEAGHCRFVVVANSREDHCLYYVGSNPAGIIFPVSETEEGVVYG